MALYIYLYIYSIKYISFHISKKSVRKGGLVGFLLGIKMDLGVSILFVRSSVPLNLDQISHMQ